MIETRRYNVVVFDENGDRVLDEHVIVSPDLWTEGEAYEEYIARGQTRETFLGAMAAYHAAPDICPFDCDNCREK